MLRVGVIGCGYWGPNFVRNFQRTEGADMVAVADLSPGRLDRMRAMLPHLETTTDAEKLLSDPELDAVVVTTPVSSHFDLARRALEGGKHVLVTKPFTRTAREAEDLIALAERVGRVVMVDHTFVYTGAVRTIGELIETGELGNLHYCDSARVNLGLLQPDTNVLWDLGPHDLSILEHWLRARPVKVSAVGSDPIGYSERGFESVVYVNLWLEDGMLAHLHLSWLSPVKLRRTLISGSRKMVVYDHLDPDHQVKIYDKGVDVTSSEERYEMLVQYRVGNMQAPKVDQTEALELECRHFVECCRDGARPITGGEAGLRVVRVLEAAQLSMDRGGEVISLAS